MRVSIVGTVGVPANYGGFETLVEQLVRHNDPLRARERFKPGGIEYTVYCSSKAYDDQPEFFQNAKLKYIRLNANGVQSILYDIVSLIRATHHSDTILVLGVSGCAFLPLYRMFSKKRLVINIDGLEHKRDKWSNWARRFLKFSEGQAVKYGDVIVTDNQGITDYVKAEYGKPSTLIAYGGDHVLMDIDETDKSEILDEYGLEEVGYSLAICRIEPENNVDKILSAYDGTDEKLVFIGNWQKSEYGQALWEKYKDSDNIKLIPAVYDLKVLNVLRQSCKLYLHGHSAGGTNPSLVEAMHFGMPIIAYDCIYNRETTENKAEYFTDSVDLKSKITDFIEKSNNGAAMQEIANRRYTWNVVAKQYEELY